MNLTDKITVTNEDCMELMKRYPDKYFDLAVVDPPFGIGNFVQTGGNVRGKAVTWNNEIPSDSYFDELRRIGKHRIIFGANYYNQFDSRGGAIVWVKNQPMPNFSKAVIASCSMHKKIEVYTQTWTNFVNTKETGHPCEMPISLYDWIFKNYAEQGMKILDTHLGSGSSAISADKAGLEFVGCELDKEYFDKMVDRFQKYHSQQKLF